MTKIGTRSAEHMDEYIMCRIAKAVAVHWQSIPHSVQIAITQQATYQNDRNATEQLQQRLEKFIGLRRHTCRDK